MPKTSLSPELFDALGLKSLQLSSDFCQIPSVEQSQVAVTEYNKEQVVSSSINESAGAFVSEVVDSSVENVQAVFSPSIKLIFVGQGLEQVWLDEDNYAWQLMSNMLHALQVSEENVLYFDTSLLHTEDAIEMTLEEIIETGVDQVFCFDEDGALNELLAEGLQVEILPDLEVMLTHPHAKKHSYYRLASYVG